MPLCPKCGTDNHQALKECMYCGVTLKQEQETKSLRSDAYLDQRASSIGEGKKRPPLYIFYLMVALFVPLFGFFFYYQLRKTDPKYAMLMLVVSIISLVFNISIADIIINY